MTACSTVDFRAGLSIAHDRSTVDFRAGLSVDSDPACTTRKTL